MLERTVVFGSWKVHLGLALFSGLVFWLQVSRPADAVMCWSVLGGLLFLAVSHPARFWPAITGIFGFEGGLLLGLFLGVENRWLWLGCGFAGSLLATLGERLRLHWTGATRTMKPLKLRMLLREMGLGAFAGSVAASVLSAELARLYLLAALIVALRLALDKKRPL